LTDPSAFLHAKYIVAYLFKEGIVEPQQTAIARQPLCKHAKIPQPLLSNVRTQQWSKCLKMCFLCGQCRDYIRIQSDTVSQFGSESSRQLTAEVGLSVGSQSSPGSNS
jgi:hypothetical protein